MHIVSSSLIDDPLVGPVRPKDIRNSSEHSFAGWLFVSAGIFGHYRNLNVTASIGELLKLHLLPDVKNFLLSHGSVSSELLTRRDPILHVAILWLLEVLLLSTLAFFLPTIALLLGTTCNDSIYLILRSRSSTATSLDFHRKSLVHPLLVLSRRVLVLHLVHFGGCLLRHLLVASHAGMLPSCLTLHFLHFHVWRRALGPILVHDLVLLLFRLLLKNWIDLLDARLFSVLVVHSLCCEMTWRICPQLYLVWLLLLRLSLPTIFII